MHNLLSRLCIQEGLTPLNVACQEGWKWVGPPRVYIYHACPPSTCGLQPRMRFPDHQCTYVHTIVGPPLGTRTQPISHWCMFVYYMYILKDMQYTLK